MPQLDKLAFSTQYIWLTLFVVVLYYITVEFFATQTFKGLKVRNIVQKIYLSYSGNSFNYFFFEDLVKTSLNSSLNKLHTTNAFNFLNATKKLKLLNKLNREI